MMDMDGLSKVRQGVFSVASTPWLASVYPSEFLSGVSGVSCLYIDHGDRIEDVVALGFPHAHLPEDVKRGEPHECDEFRTYLVENGPRGYGDLLYLLDMYQPKLSSPELEIDVSPVKPKLTSELGAIIEWMLRDSRGHLVWDHQLESIAGLFFLTAKQRIKLRKDYNKKLPEAFDQLRQVTVQEGWTLDRVVQHRLERGELNHTTFVPSCRGAYVLSRVLFPQTIDGKQLPG